MKEPCLFNGFDFGTNFIEQSVLNCFSFLTPIQNPDTAVHVPTFAKERRL